MGQSGRFEGGMVYHLGGPFSAILIPEEWGVKPAKERNPGLSYRDLREDQVERLVGHND